MRKIHNMFKNSRFFTFFALVFLLLATTGCYHVQNGENTKNNGKKQGTSVNGNSADENGDVEDEEGDTDENGGSKQTEPTSPEELNALLKQAEKSQNAVDDANSSGDSVKKGGADIK